MWEVFTVGLKSQTLTKASFSAEQQIQFLPEHEFENLTQQLG